MSNYTLDIQRVRQNRFNYCGPACLKMVGQAYDIFESQDEIWNITRGLNQEPDKWYTDPAAMADYLATKEEISQVIAVDDFSFETATSAFKKMVLTVAKYKHAPAFLVNGGMHWVVMSGVSVDFEDTTMENGRVKSIFVTNPARGLGTSSPILYVTNDAFFGEVFTPVEIEGLWNGKLVSVVEDSNDEIDQITFPDRTRPIGGGVNILADEATDLILEDIASYGLGVGRPLLAGGFGLTSTSFKVIDRTTGIVSLYSYIEYNGELSLARFSPQFVQLVSIIGRADEVAVPLIDEAVKTIVNRFGSMSGVQLDEQIFSFSNLENSALERFFLHFSVDDVQYLIDGRNEIIKMAQETKLLGG